MAWNQKSHVDITNALSVPTSLNVPHSDACTFCFRFIDCMHVLVPFRTNLELPK